VRIAIAIMGMLLPEPIGLRILINHELLQLITTAVTGAMKAEAYSD
jgi:hypothetical protein